MKEANKQAMNKLLKYFARRGYTKSTVSRWVIVAVEYIVFLEKYGRTIDDIGDLLNSEGRVVQKEQFGVRDYLDTKTEYSVRYLNYLHHVMKRLYIAWEKHFPIDNEEFPKVKKEPERIMLTTNQVLKIAETARKIWVERLKSNKDDFQELRDYALILIGIDTGARRYQISEIDVKDFSPKKGTLFIPAAKGGRDTSRVLGSITNDVLVLYTQKRKKIDFQERDERSGKIRQPMFLVDDMKKRISLTSMSKIVNAIAEKAGYNQKGIGFHVFRRAKVWRLKKAGCTEEEINDIMGWKRGSRQSHIYGSLDQREVQSKAAQVDDILKNKDNNSEMV